MTAVELVENSFVVVVDTEIPSSLCVDGLCEATGSALELVV